VTLNSTLRWDHPITLLPVNVFIGRITLVMHVDKLSMVLFADTMNVSRDFKARGIRHEISDPRSHEAGIQFAEYFVGKRTAFDLTFELKGTEFQDRVWKALIEIPYGQTLSYANIAEKINNPRAYRAVGSSCGANPLPIIIPCHRVLASNGSLGGYAGGLQIKKALLDHEQQLLNM